LKPAGPPGERENLSPHAGAKKLTLYYRFSRKPSGDALSTSSCRLDPSYKPPIH
jgi:hypothetical protein